LEEKRKTNQNPECSRLRIIKGVKEELKAKGRRDTQQVKDKQMKHLIWQ